MCYFYLSESKLLCLIFFSFSLKFYGFIFSQLNKTPLCMYTTISLSIGGCLHCLHFLIILNHTMKRSKTKLPYDPAAPLLAHTQRTPYPTAEICTMYFYLQSFINSQIYIPMNIYGNIWKRKVNRYM